MDQIRSLFVYFSFFLQRNDKLSTNLTKKFNSIDGVLGARTWGDRMESANEPLSYGDTPTTYFLVW